MKVLSSTLALLSALAPLALAPQANAYEIIDSGQINGYEIETIFEGPTRTDKDVIAIWGPKGLERIEVTCAPFDWSARGANTSKWVDEIARAWCF